MAIGDTMTTITMKPEHWPDAALPIDAEFAQLYVEKVCEGAQLAKSMSVAIVGLARNLGNLFSVTKQRVCDTADLFDSSTIIVVENDSTDGTDENVRSWAVDDPKRVIVQTTKTGRPQLRGFEPERMQAMAEYRTRCQELVREHCPSVDYVIVLDLDAWGGWSDYGILSGIAWHEQLQAGAMASTSLFKHAGIQVSGVSQWCHYDQFAFRLYGYGMRMETWFPFWLPPVGSRPVPVFSAFGGLAIYRTEAYLQGEYSSPDGDCEHVHFHKSIAEKGWPTFLNPAQRCVMSWLVEEDPSCDAGKHVDN